ncbi:MAG: GNAT family N-acetyltransferase [Thermoplasmataceae archaeon]
MSIEIKKLSIGDLETLIEVARESWKWTYASIYSEEYIESWIRGKYSKEKLLNEIVRSQSNLDILFLGAFADSTLTGFIELKLSADKAELLRLYLKPEYTHRKIGRALLLEAEKFMKSRGISECRLFVHRQNSVGFSFYYKNGFKVKGTDGSDFIMEKKYE